MNGSVVLGHGMVGKATMKSLGITHFFSRSESNVALNDLHNFKYIYICLPTPNSITGKQDIDNIRYYIEQISRSQPNGERSVFIIRSTILPGTCKKLVASTGADIVHVPEFLTEATWDQDASWPDIVVIGSDDEVIKEQVVGIFRARFKGAEYFITDFKTAETIKYTVNNFYALKVIFANQIYDFCGKHGANYEVVKKACYARKWIGRNHLDVWHKGGRGAGGKCLYKDLEAFATFSHLPLLEFANKINRALIMSNPKK